MIDRKRGSTLLIAASKGALCGLAGVAIMTVGEKAEQALTQRKDSYEPARTLLTLLGNNPTQRDKPVRWNHLMHWGTGLLLGSLRGIWSATGIRGGVARSSSWTYSTNPSIRWSQASPRTAGSQHG